MRKPYALDGGLALEPHDQADPEGWMRVLRALTGVTVATLLAVAVLSLATLGPARGGARAPTAATRAAP